MQTICIECAIKKGRRIRAKSDRKERIEARERVKSRSQWLREAQASFNAYIRARDSRDGCISCDRPASWGGQWHASHYRPAGNCSSLRFHEWNVHKACSICNNHKSGNLVEYRKRLMEKIGADAVEWLESQNQSFKWDVDDLKEIKSLYRRKVRELDN